MTDAHPGTPGAGPGWTAFLITQLGSLAASRYAERLGPLGLNPAHTGLLRAVAAEPGRSQQALASQLSLLPSRLVTLVDELEQLGLVERRRNAADRRNYALQLTEAGEDAIQAIGRVATQHGADFLEPLDQQERRQLHDLLTRIAAHHGLAPGVHPGYASLVRDEAGRRPRSPRPTD
jgi:DNA-binding MarR family transcriptional regulator